MWTVRVVPAQLVTEHRQTAPGRLLIEASTPGRFA
jgi:hypothetical protein